MLRNDQGSDYIDPQWYCVEDRKVVRKNRKGKIKIERKMVFNQKKKKIIDLPKITIY
jgi:hypothetical protein